MSARRHERTAARSAALQLLYTGEIQNSGPSKVLDEGLCLAEDGPLSDYALMLARGVEEHLDELDAHLSATSENWTVSRMPIVDRCILRLAAFEMLYVDEVPISVSINEAVELAKVFGGEDESPRFVNGVLGRIAKTIEPDDADADVVEAPCAEASEEIGTDAADLSVETDGAQRDDADAASKEEGR